MKEYKVSAELLQAIVNILQEAPAKVSFKVLQAIDLLIQQEQPPQIPVENK